MEGEPGRDGYKLTVEDGHESVETTVYDEHGHPLKVISSSSKKGGWGGALFRLGHTIWNLTHLKEEKRKE